MLSKSPTPHLNLMDHFWLSQVKQQKKTWFSYFSTILPLSSGRELNSRSVVKGYRGCTHLALCERWTKVLPLQAVEAALASTIQVQMPVQGRIAVQTNCRPSSSDHASLPFALLSLFFPFTSIDASRALFRVIRLFVLHKFRKSRTCSL
jgi:hypothetical protein